MDSIPSNEQITYKFWWTSAAGPKEFEIIKQTIALDSNVIVSAPWKLNTNEVEDLKKTVWEKIATAVNLPDKVIKITDKVTDLLITCFNEKNYEIRQKIFDMIRARFEYIKKKLNLSVDLTKDFEELAQSINNQQSEDFVKSRGEYLNAKLLANYLGKNFIDAKDIIFLNKEREADREQTQQAIKEKIQNNNAVIPWFYGTWPKWEITTFERWGSDITGALIAAALKNTYYNMTDVKGVYTADPRIVGKPQHLDNLTYAELRTLGKYGANVFHASATIPWETANITTQIRKTGDSSETCTTVTKELPDNIDQKESRLLGITALWEKDKIKQVVQDPKAVPEGQILISIIYRNLNDEIKNNIQSIIKEKNPNIQPITNQDDESVISYLVDQKDNTIQTLHSALCEPSSTTE